MKRAYAVVDLFAGPGGLAEGFSSVVENGHRPFSIVLSVEKEAAAHKTLLLRSFLRQFETYPKQYYDYLNERTAEPDWASIYPTQWAKASEEALQHEIGNPAQSSVLNKQLDEIRETHGDRIVLIGGPPCQAYSLAGRVRNNGKKGYVPEDDHRHFLYKEYIRILKRLQPVAFVMENVKGLLSSAVDGERIFDKVLSDLRECGKGEDGYTLVPLSPKQGRAASAANSNNLPRDSRDYVLRAENFGVPQARHRVILVGIRATINELDWYYYNISRTENPTAEQQEQFYLLQVGVPRLIKLALEARPSFDVPTLLFRRHPERSVAVLEIAAGMGMIEHGRRVAQTVSSGLCRIELAGDHDFLITLPSVIPDEDYYQRAVSEHYRNLERDFFDKRLRSEAGQKLGKEAQDLLTELVYPFHDHFIGYGAAPLLDHMFFGIASHEVSLYEGYDTFNYATEFGGIRFQKYVLALTYIISLFMKHERFAEALVKKVPTVRLENVLTISSETDGFVESMRDALNYFGAGYEAFQETTLEEARQIFEVLSVSRKNTALLARTGSPLPLLIQCSDHDVIRCLAAARSTGIQFLLASLRQHYPGDYDRHQRLRENSMRLAMKRILNDAYSGLTYLDNIKIRLGGRVLTDIDLVVMEESSGTVFLCQLKHQEIYGADLHARQIRSARLLEGTSRWLSAVAKWIEAVGQPGVRQSLRLPAKFPPLTLYRLVVSRHHAFPLKDLARDPSTTYANWDLFFNAVELAKQRESGDRKLAELLMLLKMQESPGGLQEHLPEPRSEWRIRDLRFTITQDRGRRVT